ncbi:MAG: D-ribose pyranase [Fusobacteriaceae bacterium]|nr:D-ribose pyranase [Fusobacteriaceae bacterium]
MLKGNLLNSEIIKVISEMGHTDEIVIADAGLPIPKDVKRIDLALVNGTPPFMEVLETLLKTYECEEYVLAEEITENNPKINESIRKLLSDKKVNYISHEEFKIRCKNAKAIIRTGECTPYANIILKSGVIF